MKNLYLVRTYVWEKDRRTSVRRTVYCLYRTCLFLCSSRFVASSQQFPFFFVWYCTVRTYSFDWRIHIQKLEFFFFSLLPIVNNSFSYITIIILFQWIFIVKEINIVFLYCHCHSTNLRKFCRHLSIFYYGIPIKLCTRVVLVRYTIKTSLD